mmetsp:Transcript_55547/g.136269  ORF Transcript_55547/g.136269 Transcript_55547/m.136269 type:complete len:651 (-) Transcript_55547:297-2249(-)
MSTGGLQDLRREHYAELPEPKKEPEKVQHVIADQYMKTLEQYIDRLSDHVRKIQDEELAVTNQFSAALLSLQTKSHEKRRTREDVARDVYQKKISKIRDKRKKYREMLYDAHAERKKLIDSMQIQKDEDDILRRKLAKLNALNAGETSREQRRTALVDWFAVVFAILQLALIIIYALVADYRASAGDATSASCADYAGRLRPVAPHYQFYTDVALFALVGFGFVMTFLRKYQYSAIGYTLLVVAFAFQWTIVVAHFFRMAAQQRFSDFVLDQQDLLVGMYGAIVVLISYGAVLGVLSAVQLLFVALVEVVVYGINVWLATRYLWTYQNALTPFDEATGTGGVPTLAGPWHAFGLGGDAAHVHVFGAYFGLALAIPLSKRVAARGRGHDDRASSYTSDMFAMVGTVFMFVLWPSFNAALAPSAVQHRVVVNTVLSLCSSVVFAFLGSRVFRGGKFDMIDIQNATLSGGVGIGSAAALLVSPGSAMIIGAVCAVLSTLGYAYVSPLLAKRGVVDTRGVHNAHGIPGLVGAVASVVSIAIAYDTSPFVYGQRLDELFPQGATTAAWHLASLLVTLLLAIPSGLVLGLVLAGCTSPTRRLYSDEVAWRVSGDFELSSTEDDDDGGSGGGGGGGGGGGAAGGAAGGQRRVRAPRA